MSRGTELVRLILKKIKECPDAEGLMEPLKIDGYDEKTISDRIKLLRDTGHVSAVNSGELGHGCTDWINVKLTKSGHRDLTDIDRRKTGG